MIYTCESWLCDASNASKDRTKHTLTCAFMEVVVPIYSDYADNTARYSILIDWEYIKIYQCITVCYHPPMCTHPLT